MKRFTLLLLALYGIASVSCPLTHPPPSCCGSLQNPVRIFQQIAARADEVPIELQGCGSNREEITAITINGTLEGCSTVRRGSRLHFLTLDVEFTTSAARCQGTQGDIPHRLVTLTNVVYSGSVMAGPPACVNGSSVDVTRYRFETHDPAFAALFATRGPQTLLPILDRFALGWATSAPMTCPPGPIVRGSTSRCPS
jgi:hypothetical protein